MVHPDLILLDMQLPDSTGLDVLRSIRKDERLRRTPVVMLTCCQDDTVVDECMESGANAFVVKSARWDDFRSSVSRIGDFWTNDYFAPHRSATACRLRLRRCRTASTELGVILRGKITRLERGHDVREAATMAKLRSFPQAFTALGSPRFNLPGGQTLIQFWGPPQPLS